MSDLDNPFDQDQDEPPNSLADASGAVKHSLRAAINANCKDCCYDGTLHGGLGTWREQVEACGVTKCALYHVRPVSKPKKKQLPLLSV